MRIANKDIFLAVNNLSHKIVPYLAQYAAVSVSMARGLINLVDS